MRLLALSAALRSAGVLVRWQTASETGLLGFELYRAPFGTGHWVRLNGRLLTVGTGRYRWLDRTVARGATYTYRLTAVDLAGRENTLGTVNARAIR